MSDISGIRVGGLVLLLLLVAPTSAEAQRVADLRVGAMPAPAQVNTDQQHRMALRRRISATGKGALIGGGIGLGVALGVAVLFANNSEHGGLDIPVPFTLGLTALGAAIGAAIGSRYDIPPSKEIENESFAPLRTHRLKPGRNMEGR